MEYDSIDRVIDFLRQTFVGANKENGLVAVSGGIDSAVSLTLLARSLDQQHVWALLLPFGD